MVKESTAAGSGKATKTDAAPDAPNNAPLSQAEIEQLSELARRANLMAATDKNEKRAMFVAPVKSFAAGPAFQEFADQMDQFRATYGSDPVLGPHVNCIIVGLTGLRNALAGEPNAG